MKRTLIFSFITITFCFILIGLIWLYSLSNFNNGFKRNIIQNNVQLKIVHNLESSSFRFSGTIGSDVVLRNLNIIGMAYLANDTSKNLKLKVLNLPKDLRIKKGYINIAINTSGFFFSNGKFGDLFIKKAQDTFNRFYNIKNISFDQSGFVSDESVIVRAKNIVNGKSQRELISIRLKKNASVKNKLLLKGQSDGFFSTDGWMIYEPTQARVVYMYYYRGEYLCLDTNLNLLYRGYTIDTIRNAKIKISTITNKLKDGRLLENTTQTSPPSIVNRYYTINNGKIFISSAIKADNETFFVFRKNQVIDVYDLNYGKYQYSFYLPNYKGYKAKQFFIKRNTIFALYNRYLAIFNLENTKIINK